MTLLRKFLATENVFTRFCQLNLWEHEKKECELQLQEFRPNWEFLFVWLIFLLVILHVANTLRVLFFCWGQMKDLENEVFGSPSINMLCDPVHYKTSCHVVWLWNYISLQWKMPRKFLSLIILYCIDRNCNYERRNTWPKVTLLVSSRDGT